MMNFTVKDMSCGHCVGVITKAVHGVDPAAHVQVDLTTRTVSVESAMPAADLAAAMGAAGYEAAMGAAPQARQGSSCCCR